MKPSKTRLTAVVMAFLFVALGLSVLANNANKQDTQQNVIAADTITPSIQQNAAVSDTALPQAKPPVLMIGGKPDDRVYLQSLDIQVEVTGNIASTRYTMVFKNRTDNILEGELTFPLPDERTVTHYALDINGKMREAVPVEKARAAQVFEEIQRRQVDPGILERVEGNNFRTRVYPIPRNGTRTITIGYEEELALEKELLHYRLPMAYPDPLEKFAVKATVWKSGVKPVVSGSEGEIRFDKAGENYVASFARENHRPARALNFALPAPADIPQIMMQSAQGSFYFLASVAPKMEVRKKQWGDELAIIWDVSLSGSQRDLKRETEALNIVFAEKKNVDVHLYFLNNRLTKAINKNTTNGEYKVTGGNWDALKKALETAVFDGGTDFSQINMNDIAGSEILFFSDGISTLSDADFLGIIAQGRPQGSPLHDRVSGACRGGGCLRRTLRVCPRPVHCIVSSSKADYSAMKLIAGRTKGKFVNINALSSEKLKNELLNETPQFLGTEHGKDIREAYPNIAAPVHGNFSIAGISGANDAEMTLLFGFGGKVDKRIKVKLDAKNAGSQGNVYKIWAQKKITELDLDYEKNRAELTGLGRQFGIVTRNTSLMVLELIGDYVQYGIEPPASEPELRAEYRRRQKERGERQRDTERNMLNEAVAAAETITKWWNTDFAPAKPKYPTPDEAQSQKASNGFAADIDAILSGMGGLKSGGDGGVGRKGTAGIGYGSGYGSGFGGGGGINDLLGGRGSGSSASSKKDEQVTITIKPIRKDSDYLKQLTGKAADDYQTYLKLRNDYANSPVFYFDVADWFYKHGDRETALRVLTSIADLELEDAALYRLLGYRFKEYGEHTLQKFVCKKVIQWRPMEPQSYRDYALALAGNGEAQAALDSLCSMLTRLYPADNVRRSRGIEEVAVTEMNRLIAKNPGLNVSKIDKRLIISVSVDVRVVINWNTNNVIIDMHVKDPTGEECYWRNMRTGIGGRLSADNTSGYGPEQFMLKKAVKGKYRVSINYYSAREFAAAGPLTVMAEIYTKYSGKAEQKQVVCLQMSKADRTGDKKIEVAEFEF